MVELLKQFREYWAVRIDPALPVNRESDPLNVRYRFQHRKIFLVVIFVLLASTEKPFDP
jgi:hypothetical protein